MRELVRKDLLLNRAAMSVNVLVLAVSLVLLTSMGVDSVRVMGVFAGLMSAFLPVMIVTREDKSGAMALSCSLPVSRRTVVKARYVLGLALVAGGVLMALGIAAVVPSSGLSAGELFRPGTLLLGLSVSLVIMSVMLPLTLRLGFTGLLILLVAFQVLGVVLLTLAQLTGSNADLRILGALVRGVAAIADALGPAGFYLALAAVLTAVLALSYQVSAYVFERREL